MLLKPTSGMASTSFTKALHHVLWFLGSSVSRVKHGVRPKKQDPSRLASRLSEALGFRSSQGRGKYEINLCRAREADEGLKNSAV